MISYTIGVVGVNARPNRTPNNGYIAQVEQLKADPEGGWDKLTRLEKVLIKANFRLAKLHYPALTIETYKAELKEIWDATP